MNRNLIFVYLLTILPLELFSQINNSNIDISNISQKWHYVNQISKFVNYEVQFVNSIETWDESYAKINPLLVYENNEEILFNYYIVKDSKQICPTGYRVPLVSDFDLLRKNIEFTFDKNKKNDKNFILKGNTSILRGSDENDGIFSYLDDGNKLRYWVLDEYSNSELAKAITFTRNVNTNFPTFFENKPYVISALDKKSGLNLYCIEKLEKILVENQFTYKELVPNDYLKLENSIVDLITQTRIKNFNFSGKLQFDENGKNVSNSFGAIDDMENLSLYNDIKNTISNWTVYPYYNNLKIKTSHNFRINVNSNSYTSDEKRMLSKNSYLNYYFKDYSLRNMLDNCDEGKKDFKFKIEKIKYKITIDNELIQNSLNSTIKKVIGKGPFYSLYSVLPGLGKIQITSDSKISKDVGFNRKTNSFLGISISLGVIGGFSKLISHYHYEVYRQGLSYEDLSRNYKIANISQKVFLSCLTAYSAMFLYDFSSTLALGIGNKTLQRKINKKIRKLENPIILH